MIRTAELTVRVKNTEKALATARSAAVGSGGLVEDESTERIGGDHVGSRIVLRVPQDAYDDVLAELAGTGTLLARKANAKDVTDQVVDVNSRIASQRASVARVRELMDQATRLSDVVSLEGELSTRQADLESLLAQQASLKDRTTLATITLELTETPAVTKEKEEDDPGFLDALGGGWDALTVTVRWIAVVIGAVAPFAAVLAVLYLLWRLVRGRLPRRPEPVPPPWPTPAHTPGDEPSPEPDRPTARRTPEH
ncbi:putative lipoprotein [Streptomyces sp. L-9-10]|nr:putative lipoprotein [Streptomyces sp. L-9-10]